jgi:hypothetical protein
MRLQALIPVVGAMAALTVMTEHSIAQSLTLVINPRTGQTAIHNSGAAAVSIDGYLLASPDGKFNLSGWTSLQDAGAAGWRESNPAGNHLAEVNLTSSMSVGVAAAVNLGAAYSPFAPTSIGQVEPPVDFDFHVAGGTSFAGDVLFAPANNLVLVVNPSTGSASIQNQSNFSVAIDGYLISSPTGVLSAASWTSFVDSGTSGWREANPSNVHLSETNLTGSRTFAANSAPVSIGAPVSSAVLTDQSDLAFDYHVAGGSTVRGYVAFALSADAPAPGDFDSNGQVDGRDFLSWQRGLSPGGVTATDLAAWRGGYGTGGGGASVAIHPVPEPNSAALTALAVAAAVVARRRP